MQVNNNSNSGAAPRVLQKEKENESSSSSDIELQPIKKKGESVDSNQAVARPLHIRVEPKRISKDLSLGKDDALDDAKLKKLCLRCSRAIAMPPASLFKHLVKISSDQRLPVTLYIRLPIYLGRVVLLNALAIGIHGENDILVAQTSAGQNWGGVATDVLGFYGNGRKSLTAIGEIVAAAAETVRHPQQNMRQVKAFVHDLRHDTPAFRGALRDLDRIYKKLYDAIETRHNLIQTLQGVPRDEDERDENERSESGALDKELPRDLNAEDLIKVYGEHSNALRARADALIGPGKSVEDLRTALDINAGKADAAAEKLGKDTKLRSGNAGAGNNAREHFRTHLKDLVKLTNKQIEAYIKQALLALYVLEGVSDRLLENQEIAEKAVSKFKKVGQASINLLNGMTNAGMVAAQLAARLDDLGWITYSAAQNFNTNAAAGWLNVGAAVVAGFDLVQAGIRVHTNSTLRHALTRSAGGTDSKFNPLQFNNSISSLHKHLVAHGKKHLDAELKTDCALMVLDVGDIVASGAGAVAYWAFAETLLASSLLVFAVPFGAGILVMTGSLAYLLRYAPDTKAEDAKQAEKVATPAFRDQLIQDLRSSNAGLSTQDAERSLAADNAAYCATQLVQELVKADDHTRAAYLLHLSRLPAFAIPKGLRAKLHSLIVKESPETVRNIGPYHPAVRALAQIFHIRLPEKPSVAPESLAIPVTPRVANVTVNPHTAWGLLEPAQRWELVVAVKYLEEHFSIDRDAVLGKKESDHTDELELRDRLVTIFEHFASHPDVGDDDKDAAGLLLDAEPTPTIQRCVAFLAQRVPQRVDEINQWIVEQEQEVRKPVEEMVKHYIDGSSKKDKEALQKQFAAAGFHDRKAFIEHLDFERIPGANRARVFNDFLDENEPTGGPGKKTTSSDTQSKKTKSSDTQSKNHWGLRFPKGAVNIAVTRHGQLTGPSYSLSVRRGNNRAEIIKAHSLPNTDGQEFYLEKQKSDMCMLHALNALTAASTGSLEHLATPKELKKFAGISGSWTVDTIVDFYKDARVRHGAPPMSRAAFVFDKKSEDFFYSDPDDPETDNHQALEGRVEQASALAMTYQRSPGGPHTVVIARDQRGRYFLLDSRLPKPIGLGTADSMSQAVQTALRVAKEFGGARPREQVDMFFCDPPAATSGTSDSDTDT